MQKSLYIIIAVVCLVHGFANASYEVTEGETLYTTFHKEIKGISNFQSLVVYGTISALPITARMSNVPSAVN